VLKYLRIAVTVLSLTACVLLIALWARSDHSSDRLIGPLPYSHMFQVYTWQGTLHVMVSGPAYRLDLWEYYSSPVPQTDVVDASWWSAAFLGFNFQQAHGVIQISAPMWLPAIVVSAILFALWRNHVRTRFSLRTLLIATTLVAVGLGIIAASG